MRGFLARPYQLQRSTAGRVRSALLFGLFVAGFLYLFRPFGLVFLEAMLLRIALGYGAVCAGVMLLLNVAVPRLVPSWFVEERWNVGRELGWTLLNVGSIGLANALYTVGIGLADFSYPTILLFTGYTVLIGAFPVSVSILLNEARLSRIWRRHSEEINADLAGPASKPAEAGPAEEIRLPAENAKDDLRLGADDLIFIRSADNYVEVHHRTGGRPQRTVLRGSLKAIEGALAGKEHFLRCHKSHLVDLRKVRHVSGNAQGLRLQLEGTEETIPVSRQLTGLVRERLAVHP